MTNFHNTGAGAPQQHMVAISTFCYMLLWCAINSIMQDKNTVTVTVREG